jgi:hypothetical protein
VAVVAVSNDSGEGAGRGRGDGCPDGDLVHVLVVEQLQVKRFVEAALEPDRCFGDQVTKHREAV